MEKVLNQEELNSLVIKKSNIRCRLCENSCPLTIHKFNDKKFISGNRCDKPVMKQNKPENENMYNYKYRRLFDYAPLSDSEATRGQIGIPRVLNIYESYPFWFCFFSELKYQVIISPTSSKKIYELGMDSIPSESMCYPAKLANGHVQSLIDMNVKKIFYPSIIHENTKYKTDNKFNCPVVISYPEVIEKNMDSIKNENVEFYHPFLTFSDQESLTKNLVNLSKDLNIPKSEIKKAVIKAWNELETYKDDVLKKTKDVLEDATKKKKNVIVLAGRPYHLDPEINHGIDSMIASLDFVVVTEDAVSELEVQDQNLRVFNQWVYHSRLYKSAGYAGKRTNVDLVQLNSFGCGIDAITTDQVQEILKHHNKIHTVLKIDEGENLGAAKIRIRSLKAALEERRSQRISLNFQDYSFEPVKIDGDLKDYLILAPQMSPIHFDFIEKSAQLSGYNFEVLTDNNNESIDMGLKYVNNDSCYPSLVVIGQMIAGLAKYPKEQKKALIMVQTGGGCRATNYIGLIRKALIRAGYTDVPVISFQIGKVHDENTLTGDYKFYLRMAMSIIYGDTLMRLVLRTRPYEKNIGDTDQMHSHYKEEIFQRLEKISYRSFTKSIKQMIKDFDQIVINENFKKPKVGIVGEIYVKYHPTANNEMIKLIESNGGEAVVPDMIEFFLYAELSKKYMAEEIYDKKSEKYKNILLIKGVERLRKFIKKELDNSHHFDSFTAISDTEKVAKEILGVGNQTGEGWFLTGEMINLINHGAPNIVCIQPFGCLPNHIVGKGMFKVLREKYPEANIMPIDYDPGASEVNQVSRIKLMMSVAKKKINNGE